MPENKAMMLTPNMNRQSGWPSAQQARALATTKSYPGFPKTTLLTSPKQQRCSAMSATKSMESSGAFLVGPEKGTTAALGVPLIAGDSDFSVYLFRRRTKLRSSSRIEPISTGLPPAAAKITRRNGILCVVSGDRAAGVIWARNSVSSQVPSVLCRGRRRCARECAPGDRGHGEVR
jgi:hypothetical protein